MKWDDMCKASQEMGATIKKNLPLGLEATFVDGHGKIRNVRVPEGVGSFGDKEEAFKLRDYLLDLIPLKEVT
jgi:hypothetical protein